MSLWNDNASDGREKCDGADKQHDYFDASFHIQFGWVAKSQSPQQRRSATTRRPETITTALVRHILSWSTYAPFPDLSNDSSGLVKP